MRPEELARKWREIFRTVRDVKITEFSSSISAHGSHEEKIGLIAISDRGTFRATIEQMRMMPRDTFDFLPDSILEKEPKKKSKRFKRKSTPKVDVMEELKKI